MLKILGDMVNAFLGGCAECGATEDLQRCEYCRVIACSSCAKREFAGKTCKKNPIKTGKHRFVPIQSNSE